MDISILHLGGVSTAMTPDEFVQLLMPHAERVHETTGIPVEVMLAQAALETGWLSAPVRDKATGKEALNLFNIKGQGPAGYVVHNDHEYPKGKKIVVEAQFRAYNSYEESFSDYAQLIANSPRYASAMAVRDDPIAFAWELQRCGYATDPKYAEKLTAIMRRHMRVS
ncbi:MAG: glucosaminidase domain-containing protein [Clostridia bacterium]|nr:glucosaminidase domain-containing protein [Clostridia bacterium]